MKYLLLDTNIYLHFKDFETINWSELIDDEEFAILVPFIVIREIDKHKDTGKGKIKSRAKKVSSKFGDYFVRKDPGLRLNLIRLKDPDDKLLEQYNLIRGVNDDVIIASALDCPYKRDIVVLSYDNSLLIKAEEYGLNSLLMPAEYLLPEEKDETEQELEKYRKDLDKVKNQQPKPILVFEETMSDRIMIDKPRNMDIDAEVKTAMKKLKSLFHSNEILDGYSEDVIVQYENDLTQYYSLCEKYFYHHFMSLFMKRRMLPISFMIVNDGNASTGEMDVQIKFPDHVKVYDTILSVFDYWYDKPVAPKIGENYVVREFVPWEPFDRISYVDLSKPTDNEIDTIEDSIKLRRNSPLHVVDHCVDLMQCGNFGIDWTIYAEGCMETMSGTLHVVVKSNE